MPPQQGLFPVSLGTTHLQSQGGIAAATTSSSLPILGPGIIGPGIGMGSGKSSSKSSHPFSAPPDMMNVDYHHPPNGHPPPHMGHVLGHGNHATMNQVAGPSSRVHGNMDDGRKEKKRKDVSSKLGKEISDRRDDNRHFTETISHLHNMAYILSTRPELNPMFSLRLYPLSLERSSLLAQFEIEERYAMECAQVAYDEERQRVEEQWKRGRDRVRERLMEGIEERRKRAREEKEGEGTIGGKSTSLFAHSSTKKTNPTADVSLDSHSRPPITRKLRNKLGTSPPPTPLTGTALLPNGTNALNGTFASSNGGIPITTGPFLNPHSLNVDEFPSPFPLSLTSSTAPAAASSSMNNVTTTTNTGPNPPGRRKPKGAGGGQTHQLGNWGKSLAILSVVKDSEVEHDLGEIRRGNKRRRATAAASAAKAGQ